METNASRKRNNNAAQNYSIILKNRTKPIEKSEQQAVAGKRLRAGWNEAYLFKGIKY